MILLWNFAAMTSISLEKPTFFSKTPIYRSYKHIEIDELKSSISLSAKLCADEESSFVDSLLSRYNSTKIQQYLGSSFFTLYTASRGRLLSSLNISHHLYADDT